nr:hypothetical protein HCOI_01493700 [Haemonchus contortus]
MKELLHEGGALLMNAAENMEILTRQSDPTLRLVSHIKETEQRLKFYQDKTTSVMRDVLTSTSALTPFMEEVRTRLERIESNTFDVAKPSDLNDANVALTIRWDEIQYVKRTRELLERHSFQKLSFEINLLQGRFDAMESRLAALTTANFTSAASEPTPRRSGKERLLQLLGSTRSELAKVRSDTKEIAAEIEKRESKGISSDSRRLDELKEKRGQLRARESTLEREMSILEKRIHSEREDDRRQADSRRQSTTSTSSCTPRRDRERGDNRSRSRQDSRSRERNRHREDDSRVAEDEIRHQVPSIVVRPPGV